MIDWIQTHPIPATVLALFVFAIMIGGGVLGLRLWNAWDEEMN